MTNISGDISKMTNKDIVDIISDIDNAAKSLNIPYLIVGAMARDILNLIYETESIRRTMDIDVAINVEDWHEFELLTDKLVSEYSFRPDGKLRHRYCNRKNTTIDIIPFGKIENPKYSLQWPKSDVMM
jgi:predicted nucleotidyltransferase